MHEATEERSKKDQAFWQVLSAALELEHRKGHLKWTMSELSRKSGITRSLIYYYFGRSKVGILEEAVKVIGEELVGLTESRIEMWKSGHYFESLCYARQMIEKAPYLGSFYLEYREKSNEIGSSLRAIENEFLQKIALFLPEFSPPELRGVFSIYFGCVFSPLSDSESIKKVVQVLQALFKKRDFSLS